MFKKVNPRQNFPKLEEKILEFWQKNKVFEESVSSRSKEKSFSFYDGPPFATGLPHYGHLVAGTIKDVVPRYKTMQGFRVERIWGWDTHGLPIENIVEQELNLKTKMHVEEYGIDRFNEKCRTKVLKYAEDWEKIVQRTGRWVDMKNAYLTMSPEFMESVWWVFKTLYDKKLIYEGYKVMPYCPRCSTPLSNFEVGQGYKDKNDKAITVKFKSKEDKNTYFLAWTTTPWTLPGNLALTVGEELDYLQITWKKIVDSKGFEIREGEKYILAVDRVDALFGSLVDLCKDDGKISGEYITSDGNIYIISEPIKGKDLVGKKYKPIFNYYKNPKKAFEIISGDFVSTEEGTGIVHTAPAFGEDDYEVAKAHGIDFFMPVDDLGNFTIDVSDYAGKSVIKPETNEKIIKDLGNKVIKTEDLNHSYPHCWRCKTPLIYKGVSSWFVAVKKIKKKIQQLNKNIYWLPDSVGHSRFAKLIQNAPDWSISRNRFWGTPLPVFKCEDCGKSQVFGSIKELEKKTGEKIDDIHLHKVSKLEILCQCGKKAKLSGEVLDCWFESGSMPYASIHYPAKNKEKFKRDFPADFIAEGIDQTRGWFYSLLVLSTALFEKSAYKSVAVNGTILAEDGQKMSKSLKNYPDPMDIVHRYGADSMRFYLMSSPAVKADDLRFSEAGVDEVLKKVILTLWNSYSFFVTYASLDKFKPKSKLSSENVLDKWILSRINNLIKNVTEKMDKYDISAASKELKEFIDELSNWYIRRSRKRFWKSENDLDKNQAYETLHYVLVTYVKLLAPFMPFISEEIYQNLKKDKDVKSVHLTNWPKLDKKRIDSKLNLETRKVRDIITLALRNRAVLSIKVRQPLTSVSYGGKKLSSEFEKILKEEVNVKEVVNKKTIKEIEFEGGRKISEVELDGTITPELEKEGMARELVRKIQSMRKKADFKVEDRIEIYFQTKNKKLKGSIRKFENSEYSIKKETLAVEIKEEKAKVEYEEDANVNKADIWLGLKRVTK